MRRIVPALLLLALAAPGLAQARMTTYEPAYEKGPEGEGDGSNTIMTNPETGEMTVLRHFLTPGAFNCGGNGPFAQFRLTHEADGAREVYVQYTDAIVDPYTWVTVSARQDGEFLGSTFERGPFIGGGGVRLLLDERAHGEIEILFGLQVSSACPNVNGGTLRFFQVTVFE